MSGKLINLPEIFPPQIDKFLGFPTIFTFIVIFQGCFGGNGVLHTPQRIKDATNHPLARFLFVCAIAYTATSDIETALFTTVVFFVVLYMLRTKEERKKYRGQYL